MSLNRGAACSVSSQLLRGELHFAYISVRAIVHWSDAMKIVIPGGSGQVGNVLTRAFRRKEYDVVVIGRHEKLASQIEWDGKTLGAWAKHLDGADVVINLAGRNVNCRYTEKNLKEMLDSRVDSTRVVGKAIARAERPPRLWLQASTATIYAHTHGAAHDEVGGTIGEFEPEVPEYWGNSVKIATAWEQAQEDAETPNTRRIALRSAMIMSPDRGGIFDQLLKLTRLGLGGTIAGGRQYISWIHEEDFVRAIEFLIEADKLEGAINIASPNPVTQREFMAELRRAWGTNIGLPATKWMVEIAAFLIRSDSELILKSRRVVPGRLLEHGFEFKYQDWGVAAHELVCRWKKIRAALEA